MGILSAMQFHFFNILTYMCKDILFDIHIHKYHLNLNNKTDFEGLGSCKRIFS